MVGLRTYGEHTGESFPQSTQSPSQSQSIYRFWSNDQISIILASDVSPKFLEAFLIYFNALGVSMTEPVEDWIDRAGKSCESKRLTEIGQSLRLHAKHEAGHHSMMINDTKVLVDRWNSRHEPKLDVAQLLAQPVTNGVRSYINLHEDIIASDAPFGQLAIELEIEGLSVSVGPSLIEQCKKILGSEVLEGLSFLEEHIAIDVSHTHFNEKQLDKLLTQHPEYLESLVSAGEKALKSYAMFLNDCATVAKTLVKT